MKLTRKLIGRVVEIRFADHCEGSDEPMQTVAYGRLIDVARSHVVLAGWIALADNATDDSHTRWSIVRSAISDVLVLSPCESANPCHQPKSKRES